MPKYTLISSDDHFTEPPDAWQSRLPAKLKERGPKVVRTKEGDGWVWEGRPWTSLGLGVQAGREFKDYRLTGATFEDIRKGTWDPGERLKDMDMDSTWATVLYPNTGLSLPMIQDQALHEACVRAYNDFCADFCKRDSSRLIGLGVMPRGGVDKALAELRRIGKLGMRGAVLQALPSSGTWPTKEDERFWAEAQEMGIPLHVHLKLQGVTPSFSPQDSAKLMNPNLQLVLRGYALIAQGCQDAFAGLIFSGVMERYPRLKWVAVEGGIGWIPYYLERWDGVWERQRHWAKLNLPMKPSDYWRRQVWATFEEDNIGIDLAVRHPEYVSAENLMWACDYPHGDTTWPNSVKIVQKQFKDVPAAAMRKMTWENVAKLYKIAAPEKK